MIFKSILYLHFQVKDTKTLNKMYPLMIPPQQQGKVLFTLECVSIILHQDQGGKNAFTHTATYHLDLVYLLLVFGSV